MLSRWAQLVQLLLGLQAASGWAALCDNDAFVLPSRHLGGLLPTIEPVAKRVCEYLDPPPKTPQLSVSRWTPKVEASIGPLAEEVRGALSKERQLTPSRMEQWHVFQTWVDKLAFESEALELRAITAVVGESMFFELAAAHGFLVGMEATVVGGGSMLAQMPGQVLQTLKQTGNVVQVERFFQRMLDFEVVPGVYPYRFFYDTLDSRHVSGFPWPQLRALKWPSPESVLPDGVPMALRAAHMQIAAEVAGSGMVSLVSRQSDAYPTITGKRQWTKLMLYSATTGWDENLCRSAPTVCNLLRGKMRTEQPAVKTSYEQTMLSTNDEAVILFRVAAGGMAYLHEGQDPRINVHLCLINCNGSKIVVAGEKKDYYDGILFAFEDRADHEIINTYDDKDRISLTIGVLHPDYDPTKEEFLSPQQVLRFALDHYNAEDAPALPSNVLDPLLVLASFYAYPPVVEFLLKAGASARAMDSAGQSAVHAAVKGVQRPGDDKAVRANNAKAVLTLLHAAGADVSAKGPDGTPKELAFQVRSKDVVTHINELKTKRVKQGRGGKGRGAKGKAKPQRAKTASKPVDLPNPKDPADVAPAPRLSSIQNSLLQTDLLALKLSELRKRARQAGLTDADFEAALDEEDPKRALVEMMSTRTTPATEMIRRQLSDLKLSELRKRAKSLGVGVDALEGALDEVDPKAAVVALIIAHSSALKSEL